MRRTLLALALLVPACRAPSPAPGAGDPPSVLLVTIDTLRADRVGCYGDLAARTPALDGLAAQGTLFEWAFTPAPITLPAHTSLMTGLLPPAHGVRGNGAFALGPGPTTLAHALKARGYQTAGFVGGYPLARSFGLDRGFDHYDDTLNKAPGVHYEFAERRGDAVVASAGEWLATHPGRVFVWVHLFDPHAPYDPPEPYRGTDPYRGEVAAADGALGRLLSRWDARPGRPLVVATADHGEAFGEHGEESHSLFVYDVTLRVPLILRGAGMGSGRRLADPVSLVDVAATILELAGGTGPGLPGSSLLRRHSAEPIYAETLAPRLDFGWSDLRAWREGRFKLIRAPRTELYDVQADPGEMRNLAAERPQETSRLTSRLTSALGVLGEKESGQALDAEAAERLRALGYLQGPGGRGSGADPKDMVGLASRIAAAAGPFPDPAAAIRTYRELVALDPPNPLLNFRLADLLLRAGQAAVALPHYRKVVDGAPRTVEAHVGLATAHAELGQLREAEAVLLAALALKPADGQVNFNLGEIARVRQDRETARRYYSAALNDPKTRDRARSRIEGLR
ncbi:MAG TPA: sulfatase-like hydrolase/transferase [Vicinamibacteria bacterium]|nr:sulfatase-like hydrolase/transferase [Vicinamibacteria bacterium]